MKQKVFCAGKPGETLEEFIEMMRREAGEWNRVMGGQRPWDAPAMETTNIYMSYNDADPWTGTGTNQHLNGLGRNLTYDLGAAKENAPPLCTLFLFGNGHLPRQAQEKHEKKLKKLRHVSCRWRRHRPLC